MGFTDIEDEVKQLRARVKYLEEIERLNNQLIDSYLRKVVELEAELIAEKQRNVDYQNRCLAATGVDIPACGMTLIDAIVAMKRGEG